MFITKVAIYCIQLTLDIWRLFTLYITAFTYIITRGCTLFIHFLYFKNRNVNSLNLIEKFSNF